MEYSKNFFSNVFWKYISKAGSHLSPRPYRFLKRVSSGQLAKHFKYIISLAIFTIVFSLQHLSTQAQNNPVVSGNPAIKNKYTADPVAFVNGDSVYLYTGHNEGLPGKDGCVMHEWLCFSSADMIHWNEHPVPFTVKDFKWTKDDAGASQMIKRNRKFYWYVATQHASKRGTAIGVAVPHNPAGPFKDARGSAIVINDMTAGPTISWDDTDPTVMIDDTGEAYLFWGNSKCYYAKLKENMIGLDGPINTIDLPNHTEAPWIHKHHGRCYLTYPYELTEKIAYVISRIITGPWQFKCIRNEVAGNSNTNYEAIIGFKDRSYSFITMAACQQTAAVFAFRFA